MTEEVFYLNDEVLVHPETMLDLNLLHSMSYWEMIEDMVKFENKRYIEEGLTDKIITDEKVQEALEFLQVYHNKVTENGEKTSQLREELIEKIRGAEDLIG